MMKMIDVKESIGGKKPYLVVMVRFKIRFKYNLISQVC
jgi:hypothetical protein